MYKFTFSLLFFGVFFCSEVATAQVKSPASVWYFGDSAGLDFGTSPINSLTNSKMSTLESSGIICDSVGNLLFYTNGITVWNKNHEIMDGGTGLEGHESASQNGLVIKHHDNDSIYYIFLTPYCFNFSFGLKYCIVNINQKNGLGKVVEKNLLLHPNSSEKVSAVYHANGRDIWIVGHEWGNNTFFSYLLTNTGLNECPVYNSIGIEYKKNSPFVDGEFVNQGFIKFSPNNKFMAHIFTPTNPLDIYSELYYYNTLNGKLNLIERINHQVLPWGTEFSYNSENLLISRRDSATLVYNIPTKQIKTIDSLVLPFSVSFQLSVDGKIYYGVGDSSYLGVIKGDDFNNIEFNEKEVILDKGKMQFGLPNIFIGYITHNQPRIQYKNKCNNQTFEFSVANANQVQEWIVNHKHLSKSFSLNDNESEITFDDTGVWIVNCVLPNNDTITTSVLVEPEMPKKFLGNNRFECTFDTLVLKAPDNMLCYKWHDGSTNTEFIANDPGTYFVQVTAPDFCMYSDTVTIIRTNSPDTPFLFQQNDTLFTTDSIATKYQWFLNNQILQDSLTFIKLTQNGSYMLRVFNDSGCHMDSEPIIVNSIGLIKLSFENIAKLYPNPAWDYLNIEFKELSSYDVTLTDITGKELYNAKVSSYEASHSIDVRHFSQGIYFVRIVGSNGVYTKKIVKD